MPKATTVPQSARECPRSFGRQTTSMTTAAAARRRVTTPSAPAFGISRTATAAPNWTDRPPATTSATGPSAAPRRDGPRPVPSSADTASGTATAAADSATTWRSFTGHLSFSSLECTYQYTIRHYGVGAHVLTVETRAPPVKYPLRSRYAPSA